MKIIVLVRDTRQGRHGGAVVDGWMHACMHKVSSGVAQVTARPLVRFQAPADHRYHTSKAASTMYEHVIGYSPRKAAGAVMHCVLFPPPPPQPAQH